MAADLKLKERQSFWETPRNLVLIVGAAAAVAGVLGFKLGQNAPPPTIVFQPGSIVLQQPAPAAK